MKLKREGNPVWVDRDCASLLSDVLFEEDYKADGAVERTEAHVHALAAIVGRMLDAGALSDQQKMDVIGSSVWSLESPGIFPHTTEEH